MKYINGRQIITQVLDSYEEYDQIPKGGKELLIRLLDDLKYNRKVLDASLHNFKKYYGHLFEEVKQ